jgi:hypothetical protein
VALAAAGHSIASAASLDAGQLAAVGVRPADAEAARRAAGRARELGCDPRDLWAGCGLPPGSLCPFDVFIREVGRRAGRPLRDAEVLGLAWAAAQQADLHGTPPDPRDGQGRLRPRDVLAAYRAECGGDPGPAAAMLAEFGCPRVMGAPLCEAAAGAMLAEFGCPRVMGARAADLATLPGAAGLLSASQARAALAGRSPGTYLVRFSETHYYDGGLVVCFRVQPGTVVGSLAAADGYVEWSQLAYSFAPAPGEPDLGVEVDRRRDAPQVFDGIRALIRAHPASLRVPFAPAPVAVPADGPHPPPAHTLPQPIPPGPGETRAAPPNL